MARGPSRYTSFCRCAIQLVRTRQFLPITSAAAASVLTWRDLGTIDSYFNAHMDLCAVNPVFNLYNDRWPILTRVSWQPPAKFVHDDGDRVGRAINSVVSNGVIVSGGLVRNSVLSPGARVDSWSAGEPRGDLAQFPRPPPRRR